jgi:hypothetical protein
MNKEEELTLDVQEAFAAIMDTVAQVYRPESIGYLNTQGNIQFLQKTLILDKKPSLRQFEIRDALALALKEADSWIHDQLDGTNSFDKEWAKLEPARHILSRLNYELGDGDPTPENRARDVLTRMGFSVSGVTDAQLGELAELIIKAEKDE